MNRQNNIKISDIEPNKGQIEGLPQNPRFVKDNRFKQLVKSIEDAPEMLDYRTLLVFPHEKKYVIIAGNMRYRACKELGYKELPCYVLPEETPAEKLREYAIKDNIGFGADDWDILMNEWDTEELKDWGMEMPDDWGGEENQFVDNEPKDDTDDKINDEDKIDYVEEYLNEAMRLNVREYKEQIDNSLKKGFLCTGLTRGFALAQFIKAMYYGKKYMSKCAFVFSPELYFLTNSNGETYYSAFEGILNGNKVGIAGFRTLTSDGNLIKTIGTSYKVARGGGGGGDFPANFAKDLILEHGGLGCRILDPCHGWGGRLIGSLLAEAKEYVGVDPSPVANRAVREIYELYIPYAKEKTVFRQFFTTYETTNDDEIGGDFDIALTRPPYFDVEGYAGEDTSHKKYSNFNLWCDKFYEPLIVTTIRRLKKDGCFLLQVGSQKYPLQEKAREICKKNNLKFDLIGNDIFCSVLGKDDGTNKESLIKISRK